MKRTQRLRVACVSLEKPQLKNGSPGRRGLAAPPLRVLWQITLGGRFDRGPLWLAQSRSMQFLRALEILSLCGFICVDSGRNLDCRSQCPIDAREFTLQRLYRESVLDRQSRGASFRRLAEWIRSPPVDQSITTVLPTRLQAFHRAVPALREWVQAQSQAYARLTSGDSAKGRQHDDLGSARLFLRLLLRMRQHGSPCETGEKVPHLASRRKRGSH